MHIYIYVLNTIFPRTAHSHSMVPWLPISARQLYRVERGGGQTTMYCIYIFIYTLDKKIKLNGTQKPPPPFPHLCSAGRRLEGFFWAQPASQKLLSNVKLHRIPTVPPPPHIHQANRRKKEKRKFELLKKKKLSRLSSYNWVHTYVIICPLILS